MLATTLSDVTDSSVSVSHPKCSKDEILAVFSQKGKKTLQLNIGKCCIKPDTEIKFLGVILDDKLSWNSQVKNLLVKMKRNLGLLSRGRNLLSKQGLKNVYYEHIFSHMSQLYIYLGKHDQF